MGGTLYQINKSAVITRFSVRMLFKVCFFSRLTGPVCLQSSNFAMIKIYLYFLYTSQTKMKKKKQKTQRAHQEKIYFSVFSKRESGKRHSGRSSKGNCLAAFESDWEHWGTGERLTWTYQLPTGTGQVTRRAGYLEYGAGTLKDVFFLRIL